MTSRSSRTIILRRPKRKHTHSVWSDSAGLKGRTLRTPSGQIDEAERRGIDSPGRNKACALCVGFSWSDGIQCSGKRQAELVEWYGQPNILLVDVTRRDCLPSPLDGGECVQWRANLWSCNRFIWAPESVWLRGKMSPSIGVDSMNSRPLFCNTSALQFPWSSSSEFCSIKFSKTKVVFPDVTILSPV